MKKGVLLAALIGITAPATAPNAQEVRNYWGDVDAFFDRQYEATLSLVQESLIRFPPQLPEPLVRRMAMLMLDGVLHDVSAPERLPVQDFYHSSMRNAADEMERTRISRGAIIWKLYDHGFVVRTPSVTVGFDLIRGVLPGVDGFGVPDDLMVRIAEQCDVLFVSHWHPDHADSLVIWSFLDSGKPVVAPAVAGADSAFRGAITHLERAEHAVQELEIQNGRGRLQLVVYPGHQGESLENNVTLVFSPEGISFCHTGDQSNSDDFAWIDEVRDHHRVDVLMPNCWTTDTARFTRGFNPGLIIPGHENELGHSIDHREPFWLTYDRFYRSPYRVLVMAWGEFFHYIPR